MGSAEAHAVAGVLATNRCASRARGQPLGNRRSTSRAPSLAPRGLHRTEMVDDRAAGMIRVPHRRPADLRDAAGVRWDADRQRPGVDGHPPAAHADQSHAVGGVPVRVGRRGDGAVRPPGRVNGGRDHVLLTDGDQAVRGAEVPPAVDERGRCPHRLVQRVDVHELELVARPHDERLALVVGEEHLAVERHR